MARPAGGSPLFPYTTLFRSRSPLQGQFSCEAARANLDSTVTRFSALTGVTSSRAGDRRSEEHTSELQSQFHLVCRLLLEKKKRRGPARPPTLPVARDDLLGG